MLITRIHGPKYNWIMGLDPNEDIKTQIKEIMNIKNRMGSNALLIGTGLNTILYLH